ncbi:unnamed protein product [Tetraodon nigroviridis]|uniref:(spotted green pufferfish) hypothetical protein n=1 Tax=Tetraodon nigroviridis TaxID=99883 RepID=Q4RRB3_TETNG|nr:unnamed protein product [Tetraodon nigroviridis]
MSELPGPTAAILRGSMLFKWFSLIGGSCDPTGEEESQCWETSTHVVAGRVS